MPWSYPENVPAVAQNWTAAEQRRCVEAANAVLAESGDEEQAIFACIAAAGKGEDAMKTKVYRAPVTFKADDGEEKGEFSAVFATLNVADHDEDVTLPGAFGEQRVLVEPWNHNYQAPPVGKGMITESEDQAVVSGRFFLDTEAGREHYTVVKNLADMQEWSYTFRILDAEPGVFEGAPVRLLKRLEVIGVSPVTEGAGIDTHTVAIKGTADGTTDEEIHDGKDGKDGARGDEGEAGDGKPSGEWAPRDVQLEIDLLKLSTEV